MLNTSKINQSFPKSLFILFFVTFKDFYSYFVMLKILSSWTHYYFMIILYYPIQIIVSMYHIHNKMSCWYSTAQRKFWFCHLGSGNFNHFHPLNKLISYSWDKAFELKCASFQNYNICPFSLCFHIKPCLEFDFFFFEALLFLACFSITNYFYSSQRT